MMFVMEKPAAVKFVVNFLAGNLYSEIQGCQMTHAFADLELKLVARVTAKSL